MAAAVVNCDWGAKPNALAIMKGVEGCASILATFDGFSWSASINYTLERNSMVVCRITFNKIMQLNASKIFSSIMDTY